MRRLVRSTAILGMGSVATLVAAILRAKILAAWLGTSGTGLLAQLSGLTSVVVPLATLGAGSGVTTMIAEARGRGDLDRARRVARTATTLAWGVGLALALLMAALSPWLAEGILRDRGYAWVILLGAATIPLSAVASLRITMLQGLGAVKSMALLNALIAAAGIASVIPLAWFFGVRGAVVSLVVVALAYLLLSGRLVRPLLPRAGSQDRGDSNLRAPALEAASAPTPAPAIDRALLGPLLRFGGSALLVGLSSTLTLLVLRSILVERLGFSQNGIYQVCVGVSGMVMPLILNSITATVWPEIAALPTDRDAAGPMHGAIRLGFLLATGATAALVVGSPVWVPLFYSPEFRPALDLLPYQFLGDYFRTAAWMFGIWLVPRARLRPWVVFDLVYAAVLLGVFLLLVDRIGVRSVVLAYVAAHVSHAVLHYVLARRAIGFHLGKDNTILLLASFALLAGLAALRPR
ncbi:MAG TPA: oligosaccharide flippase family protein, partial [Candidatus Eisenbacteria bacterium]|nr:oligosaccharide flippase family protein [Candidatus Eisenbacteria bacterium]